jgi:hypothetical protein
MTACTGTATVAMYTATAIDAVIVAIGSSSGSACSATLRLTAML